VCRDQQYRGQGESLSRTTRSIGRCSGQKEFGLNQADPVTFCRTLFFWKQAEIHFGDPEGHMAQDSLDGFAFNFRENRPEHLMAANN